MPLNAMKSNENIVSLCIIEFLYVLFCIMQRRTFIKKNIRSSNEKIVTKILNYVLSIRFHVAFACNAQYVIHNEYILAKAVLSEERSRADENLREFWWWWRNYFSGWIYITAISVHPNSICCSISTVVFAWKAAEK